MCLFCFLCSLFFWSAPGPPLLHLAYFGCPRVVNSRIVLSQVHRTSRLSRGILFLVSLDLQLVGLLDEVTEHLWGFPAVNFSLTPRQ